MTQVWSHSEEGFTATVSLTDTALIASVKTPSGRDIKHEIAVERGLFSKNQDEAAVLGQSLCRAIVTDLLIPESAAKG